MADERHLVRGFTWEGQSADPNDEQFGDVIEPAALDAGGDDTPQPAEAFAAVLVGEPYDGAVIGRRGARHGPRAIRERLATTTTHHFDAGPVTSVGDLGDVSTLRRLLDGDRTRRVGTVQDDVAIVTEHIHDRDVLPVFIGGDNSMTVPNVSPLLSDETVGVVSLDAHLDCRPPREEPTSGSPYRQLLEDGLDAFVVLGARHFETSTQYHDYVRDNGGDIVTAEEVAVDPVAAVDRALECMADVDRLYVSLDCDVLDITAAPGVSAPTPGGVSSRETFRMLRLLAADERLAGLEVVECAPRHDEGGRTVATAARAIAHALAVAIPAGDTDAPTVGTPTASSDSTSEQGDAER